MREFEGRTSGVPNIAPGQTGTRNRRRRGIQFRPIADIRLKYSQRPLGALGAKFLYYMNVRFVDETLFKDRVSSPLIRRTKPEVHRPRIDQRTHQQAGSA